MSPGFLQPITILAVTRATEILGQGFTAKGFFTELSMKNVTLIQHMSTQKIADKAERHHISDLCAELDCQEANKSQEEFDEINKPRHYNSSAARCSKCDHPIESIDIVQHLPFCVGSIIKYLWRREHKGAHLQDLKKCEFYIKREIARIERSSKV